jgi:Tfp pilus assembly protein PilX
MITTVRRVRRGGDEGTALMITIFTMLLVTTMSLTVGSAVLLQVRPTQAEQKATRTLTAAEAGFDVALNRIRAAQDASGNGVRTSLPCTATAGTVLTGTMSGTDPSAYSVKIRYYNADPSGQSASWRSSSTNLVACSSGAPASVPAYALLESTGSGAAIRGISGLDFDRVVEQVYRFNVTNENVLGGQIVLNTTTTCLTAENHANNAKVSVTACDTTGADIKQKWSYTPELLLKTYDASGNAYCIQADSSINAQAKLTSSCDATKAVQVWSFNDNGRFEGAEADGSGRPSGDTNGWCLTTANSNFVVMKQECSGGYDAVHTFNPVAQVGAGAAGDTTRQLVNYRYFGRCLDVTAQNRDATWLIGYPCKQAPSATYVAWNQKFTWDATTEQFCTNTSNAAVTSCALTNSNLYCLSAGTSGSTPAVGTRVLLKLCSTTNTAQKWTRRGDLPGNYAASYNILTLNGGLCLDLNPAGASEASTYDKQWGLIQVSTCDGSTRQKWNAPADLSPSSTINTYERVS